jgi:DNA-damage-inducible protein J
VISDFSLSKEDKKGKSGKRSGRTVNVNFKLDADVKKNMEQVCSELGLSMSAAFTIFAKKVGREKRIPFDVSVDPFYSENNIRYLENLVRDIQNGKAHFSEHELIEVEE